MTGGALLLLIVLPLRLRVLPLLRFSLLLLLLRFPLLLLLRGAILLFV